MSTPSANNTAFGRGSVLFSRFDANGVMSTQFFHLGNCSNFAMSTAVETVDMVNYMADTSVPYNSATKKTDVSLKITGFELDPKVLAIVLSGDTSTYSQTLQTITGETIAAATLTGLKGSFFKSAKRNASAATMSQGTVSLVSGVDWELFNSYAAMFRVLPTSSTVVDGTVLTVGYTAAALTGANALNTIRGFNTATVKGQVLFLPANSTGPNFEVQLWSVTLTPNGDFSLISDDWIKWDLDGKVLSDSGNSYGGSAFEPFMRVTQRS